MAIQTRRGSYNDFDPEKLLPGEWAAVTDGDPEGRDGTSIYMCFGPGQVKRMATYEDVIPKDEFVSEQINKWLDDHPEATTTVQDGSLQEVKFAADLRKRKGSTYDTLSELKADTSLISGMTCITNGYYSANDGGGAKYFITGLEDDSVYQETLNNGLYASLIQKDFANVKSYGAVGNGVNDDTEYFKSALKYSSNIFCPDGTYVLNDSKLTGQCFGQNVILSGNHCLTDYTQTNVSRGSGMTAGLLGTLLQQQSQYRTGATYGNEIPTYRAKFNGNIKLPLCEQYPYQMEIKFGYSTGGTDKQYFDAPFSHACLCLICNPIAPLDDSSKNLHIAMVKSFDDSGFVVLQKYLTVNNETKDAYAEVSTIPFYWIAIGM